MEINSVNCRRSKPKEAIVKIPARVCNGNVCRRCKEDFVGVISSFTIESNFSHPAIVDGQGIVAFATTENQNAVPVIWLIDNERVIPKSTVESDVLHAHNDERTASIDDERSTINVEHIVAVTAVIKERVHFSIDAVDHRYVDRWIDGEESVSVIIQFAFEAKITGTRINDCKQVIA